MDLYNAPHFKLSTCNDLTIKNITFRRMKKATVHESPKMRTDEWLTPPAILEELGEFDLDPCAPISRPWEIAKNVFTVYDNGLSKEWEGRVWLNPPYGNDCIRWVRKLAGHGNGIALIFARTDTDTDTFFSHVWPTASALFFIRNRIRFLNTHGKQIGSNAGDPSVLVAYGASNAERLRRISKLQGFFIDLEHLRAL